MKFPAPIKLYVGFCLLFLLSVVIGTSSYFSIKKQQRISKAIDHNYQIMNSTEHIRNLLADMENNRRGYRSTNQKTYLEQYYSNRDQMAPELASLIKLVASDPEQSYRVTQLGKYINESIFFWSKLRRDESSYDSTELAAVTTEENSLVHSVNMISNDIIGIEDASRIRSELEVNEIIGYLSWTSPAGSIMEQVFILLLIYLVIVELKKRRNAEAELKTKVEKEKQLNELKSRFVSMASHEFRTPLASILASTYLAAKYKTAEDEPKRAKHYERIASAVHNLTEILEDLLSVDKLEVGKVQVNIQEFDIESSILVLINDMQTILKPGQTINYEHSGLTKVKMDPSLLKHVLTNLFSNAIKFSGEDAVIRVTTYHNGRQVMISVKDSGIGIPKADQEQLFDRFHRGGNASNIEGTGLGLHIVAKYTRLMKGSIKCISEEGAGTEFVLTYPQSYETAVTPEKDEAPVPAERSS